MFEAQCEFRTTGSFALRRLVVEYKDSRLVLGKRKEAHFVVIWHLPQAVVDKFDLLESWPQLVGIDFVESACEVHVTDN